MPCISIIVPVYNASPYLVECMDSIVRQTLHDIEIVCVNDGSTDDSLAILQSYAEQDDRIVIIDKENAGYGAAMNTGYDRATGEYIGIVEPDDYVPLNMFEDLYKIAKTNDLDFVKADFYRYEHLANGDMFLVYEHLSTNKSDYNIVFNPSETPEAVLWVMNTWCGIYRREFLEEWHIRHNETPGASFQDNGFYFQTFAFAKRAMIINKPYYMNRRDNPNSSVRDSQKVHAMNVEYDFIKDKIIVHPEIWERFKGYFTKKRYYNSNASLQRIADEYKEAYILRFSKIMKRAVDLDEFKRSLFNEHELYMIDLLINDPNEYYKTKVLSTNEYNNNIMPSSIAKVKESFSNYERLQTKFNDIVNSESYKLGKSILYIPRRLKSLRSKKNYEGK